MGSSPKKKRGQKKRVTFFLRPLWDKIRTYFRSEHPFGGTVGPDDIVGMHIPMPDKPGVGVSINLNNNEFDEALRNVADKIPATDPKAEQLKKCVEDALQEKSPASKLKKIHMVVMIGAGIAKIAKEISHITKLLGF